MNNFGKRDANRIATQEARLLRIERAMRQIPSRFRKGGGVSNDVVLNNIVGGSTIWSSGAQSVTGIKWDTGTSVTTVPTEDPLATSIGSFAVGLGRGVNLATSQTEYVCLRPDPGTGVVLGLLGHIPNGTQARSQAAVLLPLVSDSSVLVLVRIIYRI